MLETFGRLCHGDLAGLLLFHLLLLFPLGALFWFFFMLFSRSPTFVSGFVWLAER